MAILKIPRETKLKNLPVEHKVALRLIAYAGQKRNQAELRAIAKEIGSVYAEVMTAVESLAKQQVITFNPITANLFEFQVEAQNRQALQLDASNYSRHLKARAQKGPPRPPAPPPAHLKPITDEQRAPWLARAAEIAVQLNYPKVAKKVANCLARIGEEEVNRLVTEALVRSAVPTPPKSAAQVFFEAYTARRNVLIPPNPPLTTAT